MNTTMGERLGLNELFSPQVGMSFYFLAENTTTAEQQAVHQLKFMANDFTILICVNRSGEHRWQSCLGRRCWFFS